MTILRDHCNYQQPAATTVVGVRGLEDLLRQLLHHFKLNRFNPTVNRSNS